MKKFGLILALTLLTLPPLIAQVSNPSIIVVSSAPSGSCGGSGLPMQYVFSTGVLYACQNGTWGQIGGGGGGGPYLPLAGGTMTGPLSVQAHGCYGVGCIVDTHPSAFFGANSVISVFDETDTSAGGESGVFSQVTWNPATTATDSQQIIGLGGSAQINADSQATANLSAYGGVFDAESLGTTTAMNDVEALQLYSYADGTNTVHNQTLINGDLANTAGGTTTNMLLNYETMENAGTTSAMAGDDFVLTNTGTTSFMQGVDVLQQNSGTLSGDNNGLFATFTQTAGTSQDFLGLGTSINLTGGTMSAGWIGLEIDGADSSITVTAPGAMPYFRGVFVIPPTAPTGVIVHDIGLQINDVTEGSTDNIAILTGLGLVQFGDSVRMTGITGHGTAGVVGIDTSGNLSTEAAPACASCVVASSPGAGIATFAGGTQTVTSTPLKTNCLNKSMGFPCVVAIVAPTSISTTTSPGYTSWFTPAAAGVYRACGYVDIGAVGTAGTVQLTYQATFVGHSGNNNITPTLTLTTSVGSIQQGCITLLADASTTISYGVILSGATGTPTIYYGMQLEQMQ